MICTLEVLDGRLVVRELICGVLAVLGELKRGMLGYSAFARLQRARDKVEQGRFSCAVIPQDRDARVHAGRESASWQHPNGDEHALDAERQFPVQVILLLSRVRERHLIESDDRGRELAHILKVEA